LLEGASLGGMRPDVITYFKFQELRAVTDVRGQNT
jgi:hypothetical protein